MRTARRSSGTNEGSLLGSASEHQVHSARGNVHQPAQRPQTSDRGEPPMNSPDSSAMTEAWARPPQAGQAEPVQSSRPGVGSAARAASRIGPAATRTQKPRTGSGFDGSSSQDSTSADRSGSPDPARASPAARRGSGRGSGARV